MTKNAEPIAQALDLLAAARQAAGDTIYWRRVDMLVEYCKPLRQVRERLNKNREGMPQQRILPFSMKNEPLDGNLDNEAAWPKNIRNCTLSETGPGRQAGGRQRQPRTTFQMFWGGDNALYFGIRCADPDMANLNITATQNGDTNLWSGDYVELLIETQVHSWYRIAVNPAGVMVDADMCDGAPGNLAWSSGARAGVQRGTNGWTAEIRVPWAGEMARNINPLQGIAGRNPSPLYPWCINVVRQRVRDGKVERAAWSPGDRIDDVAIFGTVYIK